jgi:hypothetical protein
MQLSQALSIPLPCLALIVFIEDICISVQLATNSRWLIFAVNLPHMFACFILIPLGVLSIMSAIDLGLQASSNGLLLFITALSIVRQVSFPHYNTVQS